MSRGLIERAEALHRAGDHRGAEPLCREALARAPGDPDALNLLALSLWRSERRAREPLELLDRALASNPGAAAVHNNRGVILMAIGRFDEAAEHYRTAIRLQPDYSDAYANLATVTHFEAGDPLIEAMLALHSGRGIADAERAALCFALGKALDDTEAYHCAFAFYAEGNRLARQPFDLDRHAACVAELEAVFAPAFLGECAAAGDPSEAPIFVLGMPRSGTTLIEQMLASHPQVFAAGELGMVGSANDQMRNFLKARQPLAGLLYDHLPRMPTGHFAAAARGCLQLVAGRAGRRYARFIDKMPQNAFYLGVIALLFPNARVIHVRRHPLDACVSCFFQRFRVGQEYAYELSTLGAYYRLLARAMAHWRRVLPRRMLLEVRYEDVVADPEAAARRLVAFAGLDWHAACARPHETEREVTTASTWQVRQPVYRTSAGRWRRYARHLAPLIEALGGMAWVEAEAGRLGSPLR